MNAAEMGWGGGHVRGRAHGECVTGKQRRFESVAAEAAVAARRARTLDEVLLLEVEHDRRLLALAQLIREYEAEHGEITAEQIRAAKRRARARTIAIRPPPKR